MIAALCLCQLGESHSMVQSMIKTLANLKCHIHTAFGDSEISLGQENCEALVAGIGQGNGAGPQICVAVSTPLFIIMQVEGFVAQFFVQYHKLQQNWLD